MDFILLVAVLAITHTIVLARPADTDIKTKRSVEDDSSEHTIFSPKSLKFPTGLRHGFTITINGTIDPTNKIFEVVFPAADRDEKEHCRIVFDFIKNKLDISPVNSGQDSSSMEYEFGDWESPGEYPMFSIKLTAIQVDNNRMFKLSFVGNDGGRTGGVNCPIASFDDFEQIYFTKGLQSITSLLFEFS